METKASIGAVRLKLGMSIPGRGPVIQRLWDRHGAMEPGIGAWLKERKVGKESVR